MKLGQNVIFYFHSYSKPRCFGRNLHHRQKFYTPAASDVSDKFHLWLSAIKFIALGHQKATKLENTKYDEIQYTNNIKYNKHLFVFPPERAIGR